MNNNGRTRPAGASGRTDGARIRGSSVRADAGLEDLELRLHSGTEARGRLAGAILFGLRRREEVDK
ncbi:hypothetical protein GCM10010517_50820 [Streptosporangium fragile]|uniref:Uncharacterized protein n=1 Tax=Streptosporangium fragile TaxID=46186 RepID=A0ABN3W3K2_9ACTN